MDNTLAQNEELFALQSIYEEKDLIIEGLKPPCGRYVASVYLLHPFWIYCGRDETEKKERDDIIKEKVEVEYLPPLNLFFEFPSTYPSKTCPAYLLSCNWLTIDQLSKLCKKLETLWIESNGEVVLFRWIQFLQEETLEYLGIKDYLDITELLDYSLKINFHNVVPSNKQNVEETSHINEERCSNKPCMENNIPYNAHLPDGQPLSLNLESSASYASNFNSQEMQVCFKGVTNRQTKANFVMDSIRPSVSGGFGAKDSRAFIDLPDGRKLLTVLRDYDKFKKSEHFKNSWHTCKICFLDKKGWDFVTIGDCNHTYCKECLQSYFEIQIKDGNVHLLNCPEEKCLLQADSNLVKELLGEELFNKYDSILLSRTLESMSDVAYCPRQACQCPLVIDSAGRMGTCPACNFVFCPFCKMAYHGVAPCNYKSEEKQKICHDYLKGNVNEKTAMEKRYGRRVLQSLVENTLSEDWVNSYSKNCPYCSASIEKTEGCNKMTCFRCGTFFCWLCMKRLKASNPYSHFNDLKSECFGQLLPEEYLDDAFEVEPGEFLHMI